MPPGPGRSESRSRASSATAAAAGRGERGEYQMVVATPRDFAEGPLHDQDRVNSGSTETGIQFAAKLRAMPNRKIRTLVASASVATFLALMLAASARGDMVGVTGDTGCQLNVADNATHGFYYGNLTGKVADAVTHSRLTTSTLLTSILSGNTRWTTPPTSKSMTPTTTADTVAWPAIAPRLWTAGLA